MLSSTTLLERGQCDEGVESTSHQLHVQVEGFVPVGVESLFDHASELCLQ